MIDQDGCISNVILHSKLVLGIIEYNSGERTHSLPSHSSIKNPGECHDRCMDKIEKQAYLIRFIERCQLAIHRCFQLENANQVVSLVQVVGHEFLDAVCEQPVGIANV
jgi:hypothetical protein